jgi:hypothetical protein
MTSSRRLAYAALLVAAGLTGVYAESIPNFEILTLTVFGSGLLLGARDGALVGVVTMTIYSLLNPYGAVHPLVTVAQAAAMGVWGGGGGAAGRARVATWPPVARAVALAVAGALLTVVFDLLTNVASGLVMGQVRAMLIAGLGFSLWHIASNTALFALLGTPLSGVLEHYRSRLS